MIATPIYKRAEFWWPWVLLAILACLWVLLDAWDGWRGG